MARMSTDILRTFIRVCLKVTHQSWPFISSISYFQTKAGEIRPEFTKLNKNVRPWGNIG